MTNKSRLLFSSAEMFIKPLWQSVWKKHFSLKKFKEGPHAGRPVIMITGQVLHLCLTNSVGEPLSKDGRMPPLSLLQDDPWNCGSTPPRLRPAYT